MIFDGYDFRPLAAVEQVRRPLLPSVSVSSSDGTGRDGAEFKQATLEPMDIEVDVRLIAPGKGRFEQLRRRLAPLLLKREPSKLVLPDAPDVYYMAVLSGGTDIDRFVHTGGVTLTFHCDDPVAYGADRSRTVEGGGEATFVVGGTYRTAPVIEVETTGSAATVEVDGKPMRALGNVSSGHPLVFDCEKHMTTKGGAAVKLDVMDDYASWEPGTHTVSCESPYTVRWRERWL